MRAVATADAEAPTLDERLVSERPDVVTRSLTMRRAPAEQLAAVERIGELTRRRAERVEAGNDALAERKALSPKIGALMKAGDAAAADALKEEVAKAAALADASDAEVATLEEERAALFSALPNLLDPRVHDGDDEEANEVSPSLRGFESESELRTGASAGTTRWAPGWAASTSRRRRSCRAPASRCCAARWRGSSAR